MSDVQRLDRLDRTAIHVPYFHVQNIISIQCVMNFKADEDARCEGFNLQAPTTAISSSVKAARWVFILTTTYAERLTGDIKKGSVGDLLDL